jgi:hypothetical protein
LNHATFLADRSVALGGEVTIMSMPKKVRPPEMLERTWHWSGRSHQLHGADQTGREYGDLGLVNLEDILAEETDRAEDLELAGQIRRSSTALRGRMASVLPRPGWRYDRPR